MDFEVHGNDDATRPDIALGLVRNCFRSQSVSKKTDPENLSGLRLRTETAMLYWALVFLVVALVAGLLGFGGLASTAAGIAQVLFGIFLIMFLVLLVMGVAGRRAPPPI
jgi:uncharacterized membrane protein YtjA (UPF0391 family)